MRKVVHFELGVQNPEPASTFYKKKNQGDCGRHSDTNGFARICMGYSTALGQRSGIGYERT